MDECALWQKLVNIENKNKPEWPGGREERSQYERWNGESTQEYERANERKKLTTCHLLRAEANDQNSIASWRGVWTQT